MKDHTTQSRLGPTLLHHCVRSFARDRRGSALVELAVIMPILALFVLGVADFGRAFVTSSVVTHAAEAGAHYGSQGIAYALNSAWIQSVASQDAADVNSVSVSSRTFCTCGGAEINCSTGSCGSYGAPRMFVTVTVTKVFDFLVDYPGLPKSVAMSRAATMRVQ
jgi:Flp pilus assembly protein TadG